MATKTQAEIMATIVDGQSMAYWKQVYDRAIAGNRQQPGPMGSTTNWANMGRSIATNHAVETYRSKLDRATYSIPVPDRNKTFNSAGNVSGTPAGGTAPASASQVSIAKQLKDQRAEQATFLGNLETQQKERTAASQAALKKQSEDMEAMFGSALEKLTAASEEAANAKTDAQKDTERIATQRNKLINGGGVLKQGKAATSRWTSVSGVLGQAGSSRSATKTSVMSTEPSTRTLERTFARTSRLDPRPPRTIQRP